MNSTTVSKNDYFVGIITALPIERAAVTAMLDSRHGQPADFEQSIHDPNSYTWGRIGSHNVVIASLASGVYGNTMATATALPMVYSFPNIRFGLLVGIGAGVPKLRDVRLGDVVVSQPAGNSGGVLQYDLGKAKQQEWERRDFLARPPEVLLKALGNLQAEHELGESKAHQYLQNAVDQHQHWASTYGFPKSQDRLFQASYLHETSPDDKDCRSCDSAKLVSRQERTSPSKFKIHYGVIASGNTVLNDAELRDRIAAMDEQCICIEMEAAGLMNNYPCLVIRGVCDYADSHKNDIWQRYSSATAAAFAKELLSFVPIVDSKKAAKAAELLQSGTTPSQQLSLNVKQDAKAAESKDETINSTAGTIPEHGSTEGKQVVVATPTPIKHLDLEQAIRNQDLEAVQAFIDQGANIKARYGMMDDTALHIATELGNIRLMQMLLSNGADIEAENRSRMRPLHRACRKDFEAAKFLLQQGANIAAKDASVRTGLHYAADANQSATTQLLIDLGAEIEAGERLKCTPLHMAAATGAVGSAEVLLKHKANTEAIEWQGYTPLHTAATHDKVEMIKLLLAHGANIQAKSSPTRGEWTPLHVAALQNKPEAVQALLDGGADAYALDKSKSRPIDVARRAARKAYDVLEAHERT